MKKYLSPATLVYLSVCHMSSLILSAMECRIIRDSPCKIFESSYLCFVQFSLFPMPERKRGVAGDAACRKQAIMKRERRVAATDEERNRRISSYGKKWPGQKNKIIDY
ncbi:hypothetical protein AVEN_28185-1 [Araneus ventricosus]|uniref:Uncharacterized protein n=1 Tax=Araneus ventricosus TaxID=182803 RepID=A0A4Y2Q765_ARAVE|nr:hypothetical protein AVEN_28185-1 [Araneus ventricosus]